jgi:hypothetical protein
MDAELLALIDDRVRRTLTRPQRMGTLVERTGDITGTAIEDGDVATLDVLIVGDKLIFEGDRVLLLRVGSALVAVGGFTPRWESELVYGYAAAGETVTSTSFVDAPGLPGSVAGRTFHKRSEQTSVTARVDATAFITGTAPCRLAFGCKLTDLDTGVVYGPQTMADFHFTATLDRNTLAGPTTFVGTVPAGAFDAKLMWARISTSGGTPSMSGDDKYVFSIREIHPQL